MGNNSLITIIDLYKQKSIITTCASVNVIRGTISCVFDIHSASSSIDGGTGNTCILFAYSVSSIRGMSENSNTIWKKLEETESQFFKFLGTQNNETF